MIQHLFFLLTLSHQSLCKNRGHDITHLGISMDFHCYNALFGIGLVICLMEEIPAPVDMVNMPILYRVLAPSQVVVWDFWTINSTMTLEKWFHFTKGKKKHHGNWSHRKVTLPLYHRCGWKKGWKDVLNLDVVWVNESMRDMLLFVGGWFK